MCSLATNQNPKTYNLDPRRWRWQMTRASASLQRFFQRMRCALCVWWEVTISQKSSFQRMRCALCVWWEVTISQKSSFQRMRCALCVWWEVAVSQTNKSLVSWTKRCQCLERWLFLKRPLYGNRRWCITYYTYTDTDFGPLRSESMCVHTHTHIQGHWFWRLWGQRSRLGSRGSTALSLASAR